MSVKLDWQIESERAFQRASEDPETRRRRRRQRIAILLFTIGIVAIVGAIVGAIVLRLYTVDTKLRQDLINTAHAETSALRIGDLPGFLNIMRSQSGSWMSEQSARFKRYQDLKQQNAIKFTDNVVDADIDGPRGRVVVEEIIKGIPYHTLWFFWHYTDGWRHVPSDLTFWGDPQQIDGKNATIKYNDLDARIAQALASRVDRWWAEGCTAIGCSSPPHLIIEIAPDPSQQMAAEWDASQPFMLHIASPLSTKERAPADAALTAELEQAVAARMAEKLFDQASGQLRTNPNVDATWIRQSLIDWLTAFLIGRGDTAKLTFVQNLKDHYGAAALSSIVHQLSTNSDIGVVANALNQPIETLQVDWSSFFQWRLNLEKALIVTGSQPDFMNLWDLTAPDAASRARQRWNNPAQAVPRVQAVTVARDAANILTASVQAQLDNRGVVLTFRLVDGNWKRFA